MRWSEEANSRFTRYFADNVKGILERQWSRKKGFVIYSLADLKRIVGTGYLAIRFSVNSAHLICLGYH